MKTLKSISKIALMAFAILISSCSSDDGGGGGGGVAAEGTIKAKIGGSNFTSIAMTTTAMKVAIGDSYTITVQGSNAGKALNFVMNGVSLSTGTYDIGGENLVSIVGTYTEFNLNNPTDYKTYVAPYDGGEVAGSITISEITDTKIVGTFSFTAKNQEDQTESKEITNGAFNVNFSSF